MALALLLRAAPAALLRLSPGLLAAGAAYSCPRRLPFLLWIIHQAARCAPSRSPLVTPVDCVCQHSM